MFCKKVKSILYEIFNVTSFGKDAIKLRKFVSFHLLEFNLTWINLNEIFKVIHILEFPMWILSKIILKSIFHGENVFMTKDLELLVYQWFSTSGSHSVVLNQWLVAIIKKKNTIYLFHVKGHYNIFKRWFLIFFF